MRHFPQTLGYDHGGQELLIGEFEIRMQEALLPRSEIRDVFPHLVRRGGDRSRCCIQSDVRLVVFKARDFKPAREDQTVHVAAPGSDRGDIIKKETYAIGLDIRWGPAGASVRTRYTNIEAREFLDEDVPY